MTAWALYLEGIKHLLHYLDDFISSSDEKPQIYLGMCLDSGTAELCLTEDKL